MNAGPDTNQHGTRAGDVVVTKAMKYLAPGLSMLEHVGRVRYADGGDEDAVIRAAEDARVIIAVKGPPVSQRVIDSAPSVEVIATPSAGYDWIDVDAASAAGIPVIANTGTAARAVASFAIGLVLDLTRHVAASDAALRRTRDYAAVRAEYSEADRSAGDELEGRTVGIAGLGAIGQAFADMARAVFNAELIAYDPYVAPELASQHGVGLVDTIHELARRADVLSVHLPLTSETDGLINARVIGMMKPTAILVNCARGRILSEAALAAALAAHTIAGAALDVFAVEPLPEDSPLFGVENLLLTPHIAGVTRQSDERRAVTMAERVLDTLAGRKPIGLVNPAVWEAWESRRDRHAGEPLSRPA